MGSFTALPFWTKLGVPLGRKPAMWMLFAIAAVVSVAFGAFAWYEARRSALTDEEHTRVHP
jgi:hypothetical protein